MRLPAREVEPGCEGEKDMLSLLVLFDNNNKHPFDKSLQFYFHVHLIAFLSGWASIDSA